MHILNSDIAHKIYNTTHHIGNREYLKRIALNFLHQDIVFLLLPPSPPSYPLIDDVKVLV